jgi:hypothetical protein
MYYAIGLHICCVHLCRIPWMGLSSQEDHWIPLGVHCAHKWVILILLTSVIWQLVTRIAGSHIIEVNNTLLLSLFCPSWGFIQRNFLLDWRPCCGYPIMHMCYVLLDWHPTLSQQSHTHKNMHTNFTKWNSLAIVGIQAQSTNKQMKP